MLQANQTAKDSVQNDMINTNCGCLKLEFKEEEVDPKGTQEDISSDTENKTPQLPNKGLLGPVCTKVEPEDQDDVKEFYSEPEGNKKILEVITDADKFKRIHSKKVLEKHSYSYPTYVQDFDLNQNLSCFNIVGLGSIIQEVLKGSKRNKDLKKLFQFHISLWEAEQILRRRQQNRERKALRRAQETEEQRQLRREKERLAKAALRAAEPLEKRMLRREKDRVAKALSRARETEEQRRLRLERNRVAMATLRAAQTEEEKLIRRERDRIKKAAMREFETEEQRRIRREKNRISVAIKRGNLCKQKKNYVSLSKGGLVREAKLGRTVEVVEFPMNIQSIKLECLNKVDDPIGFRIGEGGAI